VGKWAERDFYEEMSILDNMIASFKLHFPLAAENAVDYRMLSEFDMVVIMDDCSEVLYDDVRKTMRVLPKDRNDMTEEECRREFGLRLRQLLYHKNISQSQLSDMTGIPNSRISEYINGIHTPSLYVVDKISKVLNCSIDAFAYR
jgi:predicted XRE-type DNA-binding protein